LTRFDVRFTICNKSKSPGIESNRFTGLYEYLNGAIWLGTEKSALTARKRKGVSLADLAEQSGIPALTIRFCISRSLLSGPQKRDAELLTESPPDTISKDQETPGEGSDTQRDATGEY